MASHIILLSGQIASGKSTLARGLRDQFGAVVFRTSELIAQHLQATEPLNRARLQEIGEQLDADTGGRWIVDAMIRQLDRLAESAVVVIDSVRILGQIESIRDAYGRRVTHIHLNAPLDVLELRYEERRASGRFIEFNSYAESQQNSTESRVHQLSADADIVIDTKRSRKADVLVRAAARLGLLSSPRMSLVDVLVGGQYGSEGKGNVAAHLAPEYGLLVRSGGPNAGHSVMTPSGKHVQHHLPSGTRLSQASLLLTAGAVIDPPMLLDEIAAAGVDYRRLSIDPNAMIITADHKRQEATLAKDIGSTQSGVGAATADRIMGRGANLILAKDVPDLKPYLREAGAILEQAFSRSQRVFVEGTQGTGLSLLHGPYPYVTSRDTTASGLLAEAGVPPSRVNRVILVCRTYPIRVESPKGGTSGHMPGELSWDEVGRRSELDVEPLLQQERTSTTNRSRRVAEFDWQLLRRSVELNGPTDIAITFADQISASNRNARRFEQLTDETIEFIEEVERVALAPVTLISTRFHQRSVIDRRTW